MNKINAFLLNLKELANPETYISEISLQDTSYDWISEDNNLFFYQLWDEECKQYLKELIWLCGPCWVNYIFDVFFTEFNKYETDYYIHKYIQVSSKTIAKYFSENPIEIFKPVFENYPKTWKTVYHELPPTPEKISATFYDDFSNFLFSQAFNLIRDKGIELIDRKRICKASGKIFQDSIARKSISYANRRIPDWELQNYHIEIASDEFDPFRRIGDERDVENSLPHLRELLDFLGFVPTKNASIFEIYRNLPRNKFVQFAKLAKHVFYPIRYANIYGEWLKAVVATGYLGEKGLFKTKYGYRVVSKDGHICNSLAERIVDDWLFDNKIEHTKEPNYPSIVREITGTNIRADWKVGDVYIEYFGLQTEKSYALKTSSKILACQVADVTLIALYPGNEYKLEKTLLPYLNLYVGFAPANRHR